MPVKYGQLSAIFYNICGLGEIPWWTVTKTIPIFDDRDWGKTSIKKDIKDFNVDHLMVNIKWGYGTYKYGPFNSKQKEELIWKQDIIKKEFPFEFNKIDTYFNFLKKEKTYAIS